MSGFRWKGAAVGVACLALIGTASIGSAMADKDNRNTLVPGATSAAPATEAISVPGIDAAVDRLQQSGRLSNLPVDWVGLKSFYAAGALALWVTPTAYSP